MSNRTAYALVAMLALAGCQANEPQSAAPQQVESQAAGVRVGALPAGFTVESNGPDALRLAVSSEAGSGVVTITLSDEYAEGLNIIEATELEMSRFEAQPEGRSFGQTKMVAPIGLTYMARGRYQADGEDVEELRAMLAHPWGNRLLTLSYVYPAGSDTSERGAQLMELLGETEALDREGEEDGG